MVEEVAHFEEHVQRASGIYCQYDTARGVEFTYCPEQCCAGEITSKNNACCAYTHNNGVYIGASLGTMILVGVIFLCLTYLCCKQRMVQRMREHRRERSNTRLESHRSHRRRHHHENTVPSISLSVEPIQPPPYESLDMPPPYFPIAAGSSDSKSEDKSYLSQPPPAYSPTVEHDK